MKTLIFFILFILVCASILSQNITNTLGTSGVFAIKDGSTSYMTLSQSTGYLSLNRSMSIPYTSSSTTGVIFKGTDWFLHDYQAPVTAGYNTFLGIHAGNFTMSGTFLQASYNTGVGNSSLFSITTGSYNTALGVQSLRSNSIGSDNTAVGTYSLYSNSIGSENTALGYQSLYSNTTGYYNTALGYQSLYTNTSGGGNIALGKGSLFSNTFGNANTAVGWRSLYSNTSGLNNTALGYNAGYEITTGSNNTCIGNESQPTSGTVSNQITLGNNFNSSLRCNVTTITSLSDARDKKNISDLSLGLDFISKLKPRQYNWDKREWYEDNISDGSKMKEAPTTGFIAQELDEVQTTENAEWLNLVLKDNPEKWEATPGNLLPIMVKAIQELKAENDELSNRVQKLEELIKDMNAPKVSENLSVKNSTEVSK